MSQVDTRIVKASFKGNPPEERKEFPSASCLLPISVGQPIHEGDKFAATLKLINSSFKQCTILVDDSVQRHTMGIINDLEPEALYRRALDEGTHWLSRNDYVINQLSIPYEIKRWDDWFNSIHFFASYERVKAHYETNTDYKKAIDANINEFLTRYLKNHPDISVNDLRAQQLCLDYLLEECAVMCLWPQGKYDFEVYPSGRNQAMAATFEHLIKPITPHYLRAVALRFKKYPGSLMAHAPEASIQTPAAGTLLSN